MITPIKHILFVVSSSLLFASCALGQRTQLPDIPLEDIPSALITNYYFNLNWNDPKARPAKLFTIDVYRRLETLSFKAKQYGVDIDMEWLPGFDIDKRRALNRRDKYMSGYMNPQEAKEFELDWKTHVNRVVSVISDAEQKDIRRKEKAQIHEFVAKETEELQERNRKQAEEWTKEWNEQEDRRLLLQSISDLKSETTLLRKDLNTALESLEESNSKLLHLENELSELRKDIN